MVSCSQLDIRWLSDSDTSLAQQRTLGRHLSPVDGRMLNDQVCVVVVVVVVIMSYFVHGHACLHRMSVDQCCCFHFTVDCHCFSALQTSTHHGRHVEFVGIGCVEQHGTTTDAGDLLFTICNIMIVM